MNFSSTILALFMNLQYNRTSRSLPEAQNMKCTTNSQCNRNKKGLENII